MSRYLPTFDGSDRWLENGIVLDSTKFNAELQLLKTAVDANEALLDGSSDFNFEIGFGIRYDISERSYNKLWSVDLCVDDDVAILYGSSVTAPAAGINAIAMVTSDSQFQTFTWGKNSYAFGKKMILIQVLATGFDSAIAADRCLHPVVGTAAQELVIREGCPTSPTDPSAGHHPFAGGLTAADAGDGTNSYVVPGTGGTNPITSRATVRMRNLNNSFSVRVGTGLAGTSGTSSGGGTAQLTFRVIDAWD